MDITNRDLIAYEKQAAKETNNAHGREIELLAVMLNLYISGFSLTGSLDDKNSDTDWVWLFLLTRSFHSLRCSVALMQKGYYAQTMALIRMVTEAYFICGNAKNDATIADAILRNIPNRRDGRTIFNYKDLAQNMDASVMYENDYTFECEFSHFSNLSASILTVEIDRHNRELQPVPIYDEILFMACCEMALKSGRLLAVYIYNLLADLSKEKVNDWVIKTDKGVKEIDDWLDSLKIRYGLNDKGI